MPPVGHEQRAFILDCISHSLVLNFAISSCCRHGLFQDHRYFSCSLQQLSLQWFHRFRTFCCFVCVKIHVLVRSSHGWRCIRADVENSTLTLLAIFTSTPGLPEKISCHQSLSDHLVGGCVSIAPPPDCHQSLLVSSVIYKSTFTVCSSWFVFYFSIQVLVCQVNSCPVDSIMLVFPMRRSGFIPPGSIELSLSVFISLRLRLRSTESGVPKCFPVLLIQPFASRNLWDAVFSQQLPNNLE
jgi:hypothetical protein